MVEREAQLASERKLIAAVIYNRLKDGMPLGIDATIRYALNNWTRPLKRVRADSRLAVQHAQAHGPAADADRQPGPGVDPRRRGAGEASTTCYYVVKPGTCGKHAFSSTYAQFQATASATTRRATRPAASRRRRAEATRGRAATGSSAGRSATAARRR